MEKSKKKRTWIIVVLGIVFFVLLAGGAAYMKMKPYLELKHTLNELKEKDYSYSLDYSISGIDFIFGNKLLDGSINGEKAKDILRGEIQIENTEYLEVYVQKDGNLLFNLKPVFEILLDKIKESQGSSTMLNLLSYALKDTYVSLEQIQSITGEKNVESIENVEVFSKLFSSYKIKKLEQPENTDREYLADAHFYQLTFENSDIVVVVGIPRKQKGKMYLKATKDTLELEVDAEYELKTIENLSMPVNTVSDRTISVFKKIYDLWGNL